MRNITGNWSKSGITYGPRRKRMILKCSFTGSMSALWKKTRQVAQELSAMGQGGQSAGFCHGDYNQHNILFSKTESALSILSAFPIRYRSAIWRITCGKCWKKTTGTPDLAWISSVRMTVRRLTAVELNYLYLYMAYPEKFWKIANRYYNTHKGMGVRPQY